MDTRVYGVLGISSIMSNWNADFSGYPKTTSKGDVYGSDKAFKYPMKKMWDNSGDKVLYIKSMKLSEDKKNGILLVPKSIEERYSQLFPDSDLKKKDYREVLEHLFQAVDVKNFGATFAVQGVNISITGAVQFGQGYNKYLDSMAEEQTILSPFRDASKSTQEKGEAKNSTLGTKIVSNEAHYFYPFTVNPVAYKEFVEMGVTEGYTEEDYRKFKETALVAATAYATNSKEGCENEFALFVETEKDLYLPNLSEYIRFDKGEGKNVIAVDCGLILNELKDRIKKIEIFYNPLTSNIQTDIEGAVYYNITTGKEV
jgi:CRISPR-associated protein Csh2